jgi:CRP-like cAMP-binding protein
VPSGDEGGRLMAGAPVEALQRVPLFADLSSAEVRQIALLFKERHFAAGETVVKEGADGAAFFLIESGEASVSVAGNPRQSLSPGDYFGEIALIDEGVRSATITAVTDIVCYGLTFWEFRPLVVENGAIGWKLLHSLAKKLRSAELGD